MKLEDIKLGVSPLTNTVYLGTVDPKEPGLWKSKVDAMPQFLGALMVWAPPGSPQSFGDAEGNQFTVTVTQTKTA